MSNKPPRNTSTSSPHDGSPTVHARRGIAARVTALTTSDTTLDRTNPNRSTSTPPNAPPSTIGTVAANAAMPTSVADPPRESTTNGTAMVVATLPVRETTCTARSDRSRHRAFTVGADR